MNWFNKLIVHLMPLAPKLLIGQVAKRYIAGERLQDGIDKIYALNKNGFLGTMDVLGESITDRAGTEKPLRLYRELITELGNHPELRTGISVKLTQLGLSIDKDLCWEHFTQIMEMGRDIDLFIRIDMEDSSVTEDTLQIVERAHNEYENIGAVIQAYLRRSEEDMHRLLEQGINVRLCKGIYKEPASIAFQEKQEVRENFIKLGKIYLDNGGYLGIATHDEYLIDHFRTYIENKGISEGLYEYQALLGVPIEHLLTPLVNEGKTVRIYVPFGQDWYAYSSRRLKENPDIAGYVIKDFFKRDSVTS